MRKKAVPLHSQSDDKINLEKSLSDDKNNLDKSLSDDKVNLEISDGNQPLKAWIAITALAIYNLSFNN